MNAPALMSCDSRGGMFDHPFYRMAVFDGRRVRPPREDELVPLPAGSDVYLLAGREPLGIHPETGGPEVVRGVTAVSAFASPAWLRLGHPAAVKGPDAPALPLYAYAPIGWRRGRFWTTAVRVDRSNRQDPRRFDRREIGRRAKSLCRSMPANRLVAHLEHCALVYGCRAAQNFFLAREECPLPTARACNSRCAGCLSLAPAAGVCAPHDRIAFTPTPDEIAEVACLHIGRVPRPVVSFGQGCEGEPLTVADVLVEAVRLIRRRTRSGTVNLNTNGSRPDAVARLCEAGLDSIRLSVNSFRRPTYDAYYRPHGYALADVIESGRTVRATGGWVSVNLLVFPGVSDTDADLAATTDGLRACGADFVQMRNLNIDPDVYLDVVGRDHGEPVGLSAAMAGMRAAVPGLRFGYFNPPVRSVVIARRRAR
ncbi:MAG: radical SAM protein [Deltaproteobacteria bacterium]|nr:radical SAM protein [Deltaproteobacteria bacterium]